MMGKTYRYPVFPVTSCPANGSDWEAAAKRINCSQNDPRNGYLCLPNEEKTSLLEFCYDEIRPMVQKDNCIELAGSGTVNQQGCTMFTMGCPKDPYLSSYIYTHPACLTIDTKHQCYYKDPVCMRKTSDSSEKNVWIVGLLVGILVFILALVLLLLICRRKKPGFFSLRNTVSSREDIRLESEKNQEEKETTSHSRFDMESEEQKPLLSKQNPSRNTLKSIAWSQYNSQSVEEENVPYIETRAFFAVRKAIERNKGVIIIGDPGCGKTALMHKVGHCLWKDEEYVLKEICSFNELNQKKIPKSKTLYLFDDAFGVFNYDLSFTDAMEHYKDLKLLLKYKFSKLIMTCRRSVYREVENFNFSFVVQVIDINGPSMSLNSDEKRSILQNVYKQKHVLAENASLDQLAHECRDCQHFPLLCVLFTEFHKLQEEYAKSFFQDPIKTFLCFLDSLQETRASAYICLVSVMLHGSTQCPQCIENNCPKLEMALKSCDQCDTSTNKMSYKDLRYECDVLEKESWFRKTGNEYVFRHTFVFEMIAYHYGQRHKNNFLASLNCNFIKEKVLLRDEIDEEITPELCLHIEKEMFIERLFDDIQAVKYLDVFTNACWKDRAFCDVFESALQAKPASYIHTLFFKEKPVMSDPCTYKIDINSRYDKHYLSLKSNDFEWFRQKLLKDWTETVGKGGKIYFKGNIKAISWVFGYGIEHLLSHLVNCKDYAKSLTVPVRIRLLILAVLSKNLTCMDIALKLVDSRNLDDTCINECGHKTLDFNRHKKFTPLTAACYRGFSEGIVKLVEKGANVNQRDKNDNLPLVLACRFGVYSDCEYLLQKKADIGCTCGNGVTPLIAAVMNRSEDMVINFMKQNVDINKCTLDGKSPLYYAVKSDNLVIVKLLVEQKANTNITCKDGKSLLYVAAQNGCRDIADYLITNSTDINRYDVNRKTPLYCALKQGHLNLVKLLFDKGANVNIPTIKNRTPLYKAAKMGLFEICQQLIDRHANVDKMDYEGYTPLYWASKKNFLEIVKLLLKNGASPTSKTDDGEAPLHSAAQAGHIKIVQYLVENTGNVNIEDVRKRTPLYWASARGHLKVVNYLIKKGSDVNKTKVNFKSALNRASKRNHIEVVKLLIAEGANVNLANINGESPLYVAAKRGHLEIVAELLNADAKVDGVCNLNQTALYWAAQGGYSKTAKCLVDHGADVNHKADRGKSPLYCASKRGFLKIVQLLLEKEAIVNIKNDKDQTPLLRACKRNHKHVAEYLINQGADVNSKDIFGESPLLWAAENGYYDVVKLLCDSKCNVNDISEKLHETALYRAAKNGFVEICRYLLKMGANSNLWDKDKRTPLDIAERMGHTEIVEILNQ